MASWMVHLRIADQLMDRIGDLDETAFVMGSIAPDSGAPGPAPAVYTPPKSVSHFRTETEEGRVFDRDRFAGAHLAPAKIRAYSRREFSFFLGYYAHLLTDDAWIREILRPAAMEYAGEDGTVPMSVILEMKRDWYDLDFRYLKEHPDCRAFAVYERASGFRNDFLDFFSQDAFDRRRESICAFYRGGEHGALYRTYPYLTPERADAFTDETAVKILTETEAELAVWNEPVPFTLRELQPSQFYISEKKLQDVRRWFDPSDLSGFGAIPVKMLDGTPVMTDGHTRAAAAILAGLDSVPLVWDRDELGWDLYRKCVRACRMRKIESPEDLVHCVIPEAEYHEKWDLWCDRMQSGESGEA